MNQIDLVLFAEHSQKLPSEFLTPTVKMEKISNWKILSSHFIDFVLVCSLTSAFTAIFNRSIEFIFVTKSLQFAFSHMNLMNLSAPVLPFMVLNYFFFCYFMNHGQTYGMKVMKKRIEMKSKNYMEAFRWAAHSLFICFSFGLSYFINSEKWQNMKNHDYLYQNLITYKEFQTISLLNRIEERSSEATHEDWIKAA